MSVLAVVPAYQEASTIYDTVRCLLALSSIDRVIVVDDASTDDTVRIAAEAGATVVENGRNMGKGGSLNRVLQNVEFEFLLLIDGDLGEYAAEAALLLEPVLSGNADMAIAAFPEPSTSGGFGLAKSLAGWGIRHFGRKTMSSPLSGQRAMTRELYGRVAPFDPGFGVEVGMTIDAIAAGFNVMEVETGMSHRETGRDMAGFVHRGGQFADILKSLVKRLASGTG